MSDRLRNSAKYIRLIILLIAAVFMVWMFLYEDLNWSALLESHGRGGAILFWIVASPLIVSVLLVQSLYTLFKGQIDENDDESENENLS